MDRNHGEVEILGKKYRLVATMDVVRQVDEALNRGIGELWFDGMKLRATDAVVILYFSAKEGSKNKESFPSLDSWWKRCHEHGLSKLMVPARTVAAAMYTGGVWPEDVKKKDPSENESDSSTRSASPSSESAQENSGA